jgi:signal transduction histidine kinase
VALCDILSARRTEILRCWTSSIRSLSEETAQATTTELVDHLPKILDELTSALRSPTEAGAVLDRNTPGRHGVQRFRLGFDIQAVVHEYALLKRCIVEIIGQERVAVTLDEWRIMTDYIFDSIADAVEQYGHQRDAELLRQSNEHFAFLAHELRSPLASMQLALTSQQGKDLAQGSPLGSLLARGISRIDSLIHGALTMAVAGRSVEPQRSHLSVANLVSDAISESMLAAADKNIMIEAQGDDSVKLDADERLLRSAITNLIGNAVKFTCKGSTVRVRFGAQNGNVMIEVEDHCGGLPLGAAEKMFKPFVQVGEDKSGLGLGLAIARQAVEAHDGTLDVRELPGQGCVMTIRMPRH